MDTDLDGLGNNADTDDDNDGTQDEYDAFPLDANEEIDRDGDESETLLIRTTMTTEYRIRKICLALLMFLPGTPPTPLTPM